MTSDDRRWMAEALAAAREAGAAGEVPVGAVVVQEARLLARAGNAPIASCDPTAHAEIVALRRAAVASGNYRLPATTLYVTLEPCAMCVGAALQARVARLVFGCRDPKGGAAGSVVDLTRQERFNHRIVVESGVASEESAALLQAFFRERRGRAAGAD